MKINLLDQYHHIRAERRRWTAAALLLSAVLFTTAAPAMASRFLTAELSGAAEVPAADPDGVGAAQIDLRPGKMEICYWVNVMQIGLPATGAHIHAGMAGENGPVVVPLSPPDATGLSSGCAENVDRELIRDIRKNPDQYYVNVHNEEYPDGAIRGQLTR